MHRRQAARLCGRTAVWCASSADRPGTTPRRQNFTTQQTSALAKRRRLFVVRTEPCICLSPKWAVLKPCRFRTSTFAFAQKRSGRTGDDKEQGERRDGK